MDGKGQVGVAEELYLVILRLVVNMIWLRYIANG